MSNNYRVGLTREGYINAKNQDFIRGELPGSLLLVFQYIAQRVLSRVFPSRESIARNMFDGDVDFVDMAVDELQQQGLVMKNPR